MNKAIVHSRFWFLVCIFIPISGFVSHAQYAYQGALNSSAQSYPISLNDFKTYQKQLLVYEGIGVLGIGIGVYGLVKLSQTDQMVSIYDNYMKQEVGSCYVEDLQEIINAWEVDHNPGYYSTEQSRYSKEYYRVYKKESIVPLIIGPIIIITGLCGATRRIKLEKTKKELLLSYTPGYVSLYF